MMNKKLQLIENLEAKLGSKVIVYITGDRNPFVTKIAGDVITLLNKHLEKIGSTKKISLLLYTTGGDMLAPIRIVKIIRSYCDEFEILVPYKAHSAGTLIALGADSILMGKLGELTPVDPSTGHPFNPVHSVDQKRLVEISVEDLNSYFLYAKETVGVKDNQMSDVYKFLVEKLHPLAIGNAYRTYRMAKLLTERLLSLHMDDAAKKEKIVKEITGDITIHAYPIDRDEAEELGLKIVTPDSTVEEAIWNLYAFYAKEMKLNHPFNPSELFGSDNDTYTQINKAGAYVESLEFSHQFVFQGEARKVVHNNRPTFDMNIDSQTWVENGIN